MVKTRTKRCLLLIVTVAVLMLCFTSVTAGASNAATEYDIYLVLATSNLRAEPSREGRWVATIPEGDYVILLEKTDTDFRHVLYNGVEGYIYSGCIKKLEGNGLELAMEQLGLAQEEEEQEDAAVVPSTVLEYKNSSRLLYLLPQTKDAVSFEALEKETEEQTEEQTEDGKDTASAEDAGEGLLTVKDSVSREDRLSALNVSANSYADALKNSTAAQGKSEAVTKMSTEEDTLLTSAGSLPESQKTAEITSAAQAKSMAVTKTASEEKAASEKMKIESAMQMKETEEDTAAEEPSGVDALSENEEIEADTSETEDSRTDEVDVAAAISSLRSGASFVGSRQQASSAETVVETAVTYEQATVLANAVLRSLPSANSSKILTVPQNGTVSILDEGENGYYHVSYEGTEGYVIAKVTQRDGTRTSASGILNTIVAEETSSAAVTTATSPVLTARHRNLTSSSVVLNYIQQDQEGVTDVSEELTASTETASTSALSDGDIDYQIRTRANMRMTPSQGGDWITTLPTGATVNLLGETANGYTLVQYNGIQGYVLESVVVDSIDFTSASSEQSALFTLTGYCSCAKCCGSYSPEVTGGESHTATGTVPVEGRTIAVDPKVIPYGSIVHIDGLGDYVAEDCGGSINGNQIDVYFESHEAALQFGRQKRYVSVE